MKPMRLADGVDAKERNGPAAEMPGWSGRPGERQCPFMRVGGPGEEVERDAEWGGTSKHFSEYKV